MGTCEPSRRDADDRVGVTANHHISSDHVRMAAVPLLPRAVTQHRDVLGAAGPVFVFVKESSGDGADAKQWEQSLGRVAAARQLRVGAFANDDIVD